MKSKRNLLEQLKSLPHFNKNSICHLGKQLGLRDTTVNTYISRFLKHKEIYQLKKGLYVSADFFSKNRADISYFFYLANVIRTPSYVSSGTALQYYSLSTEVIHTIASVTLKVTRDYRTKAGNFAYQSIKKDLFSDFLLVKGKPVLGTNAGDAIETNGFEFFIASPAKALFDLLYFKTHQFRGVRWEEIKTLIEELRIDIGEMDRKEQTKFYAMIRKHLHHE